MQHGWQLPEILCLIFCVVLLAMPSQLWAQPTGCVRMATVQDIQNIQRLHGITLPVGTCLDVTMLEKLGLDTGAVQALDYLETKVCPGKSLGYDSKIPASQLKETRVYYSAQQSGMDPKFLVCAANFVRAAESAGFAPCVNAALRTQEHQRASCMDPSNTTVCGRTNSNPIQCRPDLSSCPHVNGKGMDLNSLNGQIDKIVTLASTGSFGVKMGVQNAYDPWHLEPLGVTCTATSTLPTLPPNQSFPPNYGYDPLPPLPPPIPYSQPDWFSRFVIDPFFWGIIVPSVTPPPPPIPIPAPVPTPEPSLPSPPPPNPVVPTPTSTPPLSDEDRALLITLYQRLIEVLKSILSILVTTPRAQ